MVSKKFYVLFRNLQLYFFGRRVIFGDAVMRFFIYAFNIAKKVGQVFF